MPIEAIDYWWTVKLGDLIRRDGALLRAEPLMYTPVRDVTVDGQWLARVIFSIAHEAGGVELSLALRTLVAVLATSLVILTCREAGAGPRASALVACGATMLYLPGLAVRPQLLAVVPFLLVLRAALRPPDGWRGTVAVAAAVAFWANVHGSFVLVYPLVGAGLAAAVLRRARGGHEPVGPALRLALVCAAAPLANPYGLQLGRYVWDAVLFNGGATAVGTLAEEWRSPTLQTVYGRAFVLSVLGVVVLVGAGRRPRPAEGLLLVIFGLLAMSAARHGMWWALPLAPFAARALGETAGDLAAWLARRRAAGATDSSDRPSSQAGPSGGPVPAGAPRANGVLLALFGLVMVASLPWYRARLPLPAERIALLDPRTPVAVAEYLAAHPGPGELFHAADWGGYFGWRLGPDRRLFVDDRYELHPAEVWADYLTLSHGHASWERLADRYGIGQLALDRAGQAGLVQAVSESASWTRAYADARAVVYERRNWEGASGGRHAGQEARGASGPVAGGAARDE